MKFNASIRTNFTVWTAIAILLAFLVGRLFIAVHAASPSAYSPLNVIGQYTAGGDPDFTNVNVNGQLSPEAEGFNEQYATIPDLAHQRLFVADTGNNRMLIYPLTANGDLASRSAALVIGQTDMASANQPSPPSANSLANPEALAYDSVHDRLFVADSSNNRVLIYDLSGGIPDGMAASNVLGQPDFASHNPSFGSPSASNMANPRGLGYDSAHQRLFVSDEFDNRVLVFDLSGGVTNGMNASNVLGEPTFTSSAGFPSDTTRQISIPSGLAYDAVHNRLFAVGNVNPGTVQLFDLSGGITDGMGASNVLGQPDFAGHDSHLDQHGFWLPIDVSYDTTHQRLWVSDQFNNRLMEFNLTGGLSDNMAALDELGQTTPAGSSTYVTNNFQNSQPLAHSLNDPNDILVDQSNHRMFILDNSNARILVYDLNAQEEKRLRQASWLCPQALFAAIFKSQLIYNDAPSASSAGTGGTKAAPMLASAMP